MHEVRYHGRLLSHAFASEGEANAYVQKRLAHPTEGNAFDKTALTVEPLRPFSLVGPGGVVDTFHTEAGAVAKRDELASQKPRNTRNGTRLIVGTEAFKIVSNITQE